MSPQAAYINKPQSASAVASRLRHTHHRQPASLSSSYSQVNHLLPFFAALSSLQKSWPVSVRGRLQATSGLVPFDWNPGLFKETLEMFNVAEFSFFFKLRMSREIKLLWENIIQL